MANTVIALRSSGAVGNTPNPSSLEFGEFALNYADGIIYYRDASNNLGSIRTTEPGGLSDEIQFNDSGSFGSSEYLKFWRSNSTLATVTITANSLITPFGSLSDAFDKANLAYFTANSLTGGTAEDGIARALANNATVASQNAFNQANLAFNKANNALANTSGATFEGQLNVTGTLRALAQGGQEGGELFLDKPASNTTLAAGITIDIYQNQLRFFETGGNIRGAYLDITTLSNGVGTNLLAGGGGSVTSVAGANGAISNTQILAGILNVDGAGSGLDADLLDGLNSSSFANSAFANTDYTTISASSGVYGNATIVPIVTLAANGRVSAVTNTTISFPVTTVAGATGAVSNNQILTGLLTVDGAGSGLDADLLDGQHASYYIDTSSTAQTKSGGTNALLVGGLSNTYYVQAATAAYTAQPMASEIWHDLFAFCKNYTTTYETFDGSTWSSATLNRNLFAQKENQSIEVINGTTVTAARWSFNNVSWGGANWLVIGHAWSSGTSNKTVLVETSADGVTWTSRHSSTYTNNSCAIFHYLDAYNDHAYMRITITRNPSSTATINLSGIRLMTARPGDQGRGREQEFPYSWDATQNITTGNTLYVISTANTVWHAGNDGAGSGLDADLLDGLQATSFANATFANTITTTSQANVGAGLITVTSAYQANVGAGLIAYQTTSQANVGAGLITVNGRLNSAFGQANLAYAQANSAAFAANTKVSKTTDSMSGTLFANALVSNTTITVGGTSYVDLTSNNVTANTTSPVSIDSFDITVYRSAKYFVQLTYLTNYHIIELNVLHDGTTAYIAQYGEIISNTSLGTFDASISAGYLILYLTATNSGTATKVARTSLVL